MIGLALTLDYEIFGDGTGNLRDLVIDPTRDFLDICERYKGRGSLFVEVAELIRMKEHKCFADDLLMVEEQLKDAHERGHDIQLHIHPWWFNAKYNGTSWEMDYNLATLTNLGQSQVLEYIKKSKRYLTELLVSSKRQYSCIAYRAGSFAMMPTRNIYKALTEERIEIDSSVYKWGKLTSDNMSFDYTNAYSNYRPWYFSRGDINKVSHEVNNGLFCLEVPIYSEKQSIFKFMAVKRLAMMRNIKSAPLFNGGSRNRSWKDRIGSLICLDRLSLHRAKKFDFCKCTTREVKRMINNIINLSHTNDYIPVVAIGHSKDFIYRKDLASFLSYLELHHQDTVEVVPLTYAVKKFKTNG